MELLLITLYLNEIDVISWNRCSYIIVVILHRWTMNNILSIRVVLGHSITRELIYGINFLSWNCRNRSYCALAVNHDTIIILKIAIIYFDIYFANIDINKWHLHFSGRSSDKTSIINGLNIIHRYQSCVWYIAYDIWKKLYLWEYEFVSLFPTKPVPSCKYLKSFYESISPVN